MTKEIIDYIKNIPQNSILVGDFNYPDVDWSTLSCNSSHSQDFLDTVNDSFLNQHVDFHYDPCMHAHIRGKNAHSY